VLKQSFLHVWHDIDQTITGNAIHEWRGRLSACMRAKGGHFEQLLRQYSAMRQEMCQFLSNVITFLDCFFWKLPKIRTSKFHKVLRQYTQCVVRSIICVLLKIYFSLQQCKNFENPLRIDKVIAMSLMYNLLGDTV